MWNFPLFPEQASTTAGRVDTVFFVVLAVIIFFTSLICALILTMAVRYRKSARVNRAGPPLTSQWIEALWIGVPFVISMGIFGLGTQVYYEMFQPPPDASDIYVVGLQWMWKIQHPEGRAEINELHVPVGRPVRLNLWSQDVIHSFYVPAFRTKSDVIPGRYTQMWFQPSKPGKYHLFCAEYCGTNHSRMIGWVHVMEPADYERWLQGGGSGPSMAGRGRQLFEKYHCSGCHGDNATVRAPRLEGVYGGQVPILERGRTRWVRADDRYLRDSIVMPHAEVVAGYEPVMPSYAGQIPEDELLQLLEYLKSIGPRGAGR